MTGLQLILDLHEALPGIDPAAWSMLPTADQERAARYWREDHRQQFVRATASLRQALSARLTVPASALNIARDAYGKPFLLADPMLPTKKPVCAFNVSHTAGAILIGLADTAIGVDIECTHARRFTAAAMAEVFSVAEQDRLRQDSQGLEVACLAQWTRKEAIMKADGRGMSLPAITFEVWPMPVTRIEANLALDVWQVPLVDRTWYGATAILASGYACSIAANNDVTREQAIRIFENWGRAAASKVT